MKTEFLENKKLMFNIDESSSVIQAIAKDSSNIQDFLLPQNKLNIQSSELSQEKPYLIFPVSSHGEDIALLHSNSISQMAAKLDVPSRYLNKLYEGDVWEKQLFTRTLNDHFDFTQKKNVLLRVNNGTLKAYLSNSYDRYNSLKVLNAFYEKISAKGFVLSQAYYDGIRYFIEVVNRNNMFQLNDQNHYFAIQFRNSDYGRGALDIQFMIVKQICSNGMIMKSALRKIHRGRQMDLPGNNFMLSQDTMEKETKAKSAIVRDVVNYITSDDCVNDIINLYRTADDQEVETEDVVKRLPNVGATKSDIEAIEKILMSNREETGTTSGGNVTRVANAISYIANTYPNEDAEKINGYREMGGKLLMSYVK